MSTKELSEHMLDEDFSISTPLCHSCIHWNKDTVTCAAFPNGIPVGILTNELDHHNSVDGDNGIQYERK